MVRYVIGLGGRGEGSRRQDKIRQKTKDNRQRQDKRRQKIEITKDDNDARKEKTRQAKDKRLRQHKTKTRHDIGRAHNI